MAQPQSASTMKQWMARLADAARDARVVETSAGAGPGYDFAYLHFRTADGGHSALVLRAVLVDGHPELRVVQVDAGPDRIRDLVDAATHGQRPS